MARRDLSELDTTRGGEEGYELELTDPVNYQPLEQFITVIGADSDTYQEQLRELQKRSLDRMFGTRRNNRRDPGESDEEAIGLLVCATRAWRGILLDGQELIFSADNARKLYRRFKWI